jgi:hypothetical protein
LLLEYCVGWVLTAGGRWAEFRAVGVFAPGKARASHGQDAGSAEDNGAGSEE